MATFLHRLLGQLFTPVTRTSSNGARPPPGSAATQRLFVRSQLETAMGCAVGGALTALVLGQFAHASVISDEPVGLIIARQSLTLSGLLDRDGPAQLLSSALFHIDGVHLAKSAGTLAIAAVSAATVPTYNRRWLAIPAVFFGTASLSGLARLAPDFHDALARAEGAQRVKTDQRLPAVHAAALARLRSDYDLAAYARCMHSALTRSIDLVKSRSWSLPGTERAHIFGGLDGAIGLLCFASCEWGVGARVWPALLVPTLIIGNGVGAWLRSKPGVGGSAIAGLDARRRWLPVDYDARTAEIGTLVAAFTGVALWGGGRVSRLLAHLLRLSVLPLTGGGGAVSKSMRRGS